MPRPVQIALCFAAILAMAAIAALAYLRSTELRSPVPPMVTPGTAATHAPPSDAVVLWAGRDLTAWRGEGLFKPDESGALDLRGRLVTVQTFTDFQLHIEWQADRASAAWLDLAVTAPQAAAYRIGLSTGLPKPPLTLDAGRAGGWQSYDLIWTTPRQTGEAGHLTVLFNGVLAANDVRLVGPAISSAPLAIEAPGGGVRLRNIWLRRL